jgi:hypothetical protein
MKKLLLLAVTLTFSLTAFSQIATDTTTTTNVKSIPVTVLKMIVKDLMAGDSAKSILKLTELQLKETENKVSLKDSVISVMKTKEINYNEIISVGKEKYKIQEDYSKSLEKALRKEKVKNKFTKIISGSLLAAAGFFIIVHK